MLTPRPLTAAGQTAGEEDQGEEGERERERAKKRRRRRREAAGIR